MAARAATPAHRPLTGRIGDRLPAAAAAITALVGLSVLLGWALDLSGLRTFGLATNPMVASTAVSFVLTGASLWLLRRPAAGLRQLAGRVLAAAAGTIGLVKLLEYAFGWELGVDQTLNAIDPGPFPGEMAVPTAITFALLGAALAMVDVETRRGRRPSQLLALVALVPPLSGLIGRLFGVAALSSLVTGTVVMALHTALTFVVLCAGILATHPGRGLMRAFTSEGPSGLLLRRLLPGASLAILLAGWLRIAGQEQGLFGTESGSAFLVILSIVVLTVLIWLSAVSLERADRMRQEAGRRFSRMFQVNPVPTIITTVADGTIRYVNPACLAMLDWGPEVVGRSVVDLGVWADPSARDRMVEALGRDGRVRNLEVRVRTRSGRFLDVISSVELIELDGDQCSLSLFYDISDRKEAERALGEARAEAERARGAAEEANRAKSEFLSRMSHELRTPLNAVLGFAQLMDMDELATEHRESVEQILKAGRHLLGLIDEVLDIARIETGRLSLSLEPVSVREVVDECAALVRPLAAQRAIALTVEVDEATGFVLADRQRLKQVLLNLMSNAVKYNRDGGRVTATATLGPDARARVSVTDTGSGIPKEQHPHVFTPFDRLGAEHTGVEGTGLGLALSRGLAGAMGGSLGFDSEPGEGSTFWLELARAAPPAREVDQVDDRTAVEPSGDGPCTVLYIEDNLENLRLVERVLARRPGVELLSAMQGSLGLDIAREHRPDLVLLDLHLPDLSGEEVLRELKADPRTSPIPVVVISADATHRRAERLLAAGAHGFMTKPVDVRRLLGLVDGARRAVG